MELQLQPVMDKLGEVGAELLAQRAIIDKGLPENKAAIDAVTTRIAQVESERQDVVRDLNAQKAANEVLQQRFDKLDTAANRIGGYKPDSDQAKHEARQFMRAVGLNQLTDPAVKSYFASPEFQARQLTCAPESRTLTETINPDGGFLIPPQFEAAIIHAEYNLSDLRPYANVTRTPGPTLEIPKETGIPTAYWTTETGGGTASQPTYGVELIRKFPHVANIPMTVDLMNDVTGFEAEIANRAALAVAVLEGTAFVKGLGTDRPEGFTICAANVTNTVAAVESVDDTLEGNDFSNLLYGDGSAGSGLQTAYRKGAAFTFNSVTLKAIMQLKDGIGNYLWNIQIGFQDGPRSTILQKPYFIMEDMDNPGASKIPVACADWNRAYRICDEAGMYFIRDPFTSFPSILFKWRARVGGQTVQPGGIRTLTMAS